MPQPHGTQNAPAYLDVALRLKRLIADGEMKIGQSLPTERALAKQFDVSRHSLREALRVLQEQGILAPQQGSGNYIASADVDLLDSDLRQPGRGDADTRNREIFEFRTLLEPQIAAWAAERASDREIDALAEIVTQQASESNAHTLKLLDDAFHLGLARAAHNHVVTGVIRSINSVVGQVRSEAYQGPQRNAVSLDGHRAILDAIRAGDADAARRAMNRHITQIRGLVVEET
ncbi:FCD domain-containing protein [Alisedimentitalea sp. MJ-SS2]|uniref:FadR/GntR family transcriptional regulator n=1 Tax=Aliisedimentitalea sp. MJ-SS2 TaxID=3049795 RepID=UPI0029120EFA|nr:FCD domain-containing protein [Alisedimentitalea sp. MJ-SS2]MDU8928104.1 FCD domain-containing protein [Alisedimentitalea sp. MJ-SS2]